jgi:ATP-dependent Lon protease
MFIATSNNIGNVQPALRDRMEIVSVSGYTIEEKCEIAKKHLLPKQIKDHGLPKNVVKLKKASIEKVIEGYTRESGVRGLEIRNMQRKTGHGLVSTPASTSSIVTISSNCKAIL